MLIFFILINLYIDLKIISILKVKFSEKTFYKYSLDCHIVLLVGPYMPSLE